MGLAVRKIKDNNLNFATPKTKKEMDKLFINPIIRVDINTGRVLNCRLACESCNVRELGKCGAKR